MPLQDTSPRLVLDLSHDVAARILQIRQVTAQRKERRADNSGTVYVVASEWALGYFSHQLTLYQQQYGGANAPGQ
jgi:hypothetical protein